MHKAVAEVSKIGNYCMGEVSSVVWCGWSYKSGPIVVRFHMLTSKCALRHNGMHFLNILTSKIAANPRCWHFDFEIRLAPRWRAPLFKHLNFQKCSGAEMLCTFWLRNVLPASSRHLLSSSFPTSVASFVHIVGSLTSKLPLMVMWAMGSHESFVWQLHDINLPRSPDIQIVLACAESKPPLTPQPGKVQVRSLAPSDLRLTTRKDACGCLRMVESPKDMEGPCSTIWCAQKKLRHDLRSSSWLSQSI